MEIQNAIYLTLLHSLWMGLVLALATGLVIVATKNSTAAIRYNLLTALLFAFVLSIGFVFYQSLTTGPDMAQNSHTIMQVAESNHNHVEVAVVNDGIVGNINSLISFWSAYSNQVVLIWFLIICAKCIQLMVGLHSVYYLRRTQLYKAGRFWDNKAADLAEKLGINKTISIFQSGIATVPMIVGYFKPVILIPLGMLNGLSVNEVEAILSHELAHLKRHDYLVNILQSMVEIVFFFNPGVLWISKLIREERENCCDDLALSCTESKHQYIKALIACQEFRTQHAAYAMAFTGRENHLKDRVKRIIFDNNSTLNKMEKTILTITLISALTITAAFNSISQENQSTLAGQPFAKGNEQIIEPVQSVSDIRPAASQDTSKKDKKSFRKQTNVTKNLSQNTNSQIRKKPPVAPVAPAISVPRPPQPPLAPGAPATTLPRPPKPPLAQKQPDMTADLVKEGLLEDTSNFTYTLNNKTLTINGVEQSETVHKKYMYKYLKNKKSTITTTVQSN